MGLGIESNPVGLCIGQYDNGPIGWGFYPAPTSHVRYQINRNLIEGKRFN